VAIRSSDEALPGMVSVPFMNEIIVPICHPDLLEGAGLSRPKDLAKHTLISYDTEPLSWDEWFGLAKVENPIKPIKNRRFEQMYFALQAAIEGLGVVLVPLFLVADEVIVGRLSAPFGLRISRQRRYFANSPQGSAQNPIIESFSEWLLKEGQDTERSIDQLAKAMNW
jgi:LysR family glycine cleavage system transcriptional activator